MKDISDDLQKEINDNLNKAQDKYLESVYHDNKYYTPSIEEFHVGFQFEYFDVKAPIVVWKKITLPFYNDFGVLWTSNPDLNYFRVKYLDQEDIESLKWQRVLPRMMFKESYNIHSFIQSLRLDILYDGKILIRYALSDGDTLFKGTINNISELKRIMKQLGI